MMKEIGSEFWKKNNTDACDKNVYFLSGRTALDAIIKDAISNKGIKSVLLPSYCCHTMIHPFINNGINVRFYDVYPDMEGRLIADIPDAKEKEMLYLMQYFGNTGIVYTGKGKDLIGWDTVVEDRTHSCFSKRNDYKVDYWYSSYRKWFALDGIAVAKKEGAGYLRPWISVREDYCKMRNDAFEKKYYYIQGEKMDKSWFLKLFSEAEQILEKDYEGYEARKETQADLCRHLVEQNNYKKTRKENAGYLRKRLKKLQGIRLLFETEENEDCPLFVPVLVGGGYRDELRKVLISEQIYCPVHWPLSELHAGISDRAKQLYEEELSIVCDQRYSVEDMERIANVIERYLIGVQND